jgi:hypothetical protein
MSGDEFIILTREKQEKIVPEPGHGRYRKKEWLNRYYFFYLATVEEGAMAYDDPYIPSRAVAIEYFIPSD